MCYLVPFLSVICVRTSSEFSWRWTGTDMKFRRVLFLSVIVFLNVLTEYIKTLCSATISTLYRGI